MPSTADKSSQLFKESIWNFTMEKTHILVIHAFFGYLAILVFVCLQHCNNVHFFKKSVHKTHVSTLTCNSIINL